MHNNYQVYEGKNALLDYLHPENSVTPLVELPRSLNPYTHKKVRIFAKLMNTLPLNNIKALPAFNMLNEKEKSGELDKIHTIIENSSGNTVFSLGVYAKLLGIENTKAFVSHEVTWGKLQLLRLLGTQPIVNEEPICPDPNDAESGIYKAKKQGEQKGWFNPGQYDNQANPDAHRKWTAPQIWKQTKGKISVFCTGLGTTGTMVGVGSYLKEKNSKLINIGVVRSPNNPIPGVRTPNLLKQISFDWKNVVDELEEVGTGESFKTSLELCRAGLMVGPSSGFALAGLIRFLQKNQNNLDKYRNEDGEVVAVFICADSPLPYLNEYFEYLDETDFPKIQNEHLLMNKPNPEHKTAMVINQKELEIGVEETFFFINEKKQDNLLLVDVRTEEEYAHTHPEDSININHRDILSKINYYSELWQEKKVLAVCRSGKRSALVAEALRKKSIDAWSVKGGMIEWSDKNLPRWKAEVCSTSKIR